MKKYASILVLIVAVLFGYNTANAAKQYATHSTIGVGATSLSYAASYADLTTGDTVIATTSTGVCFYRYDSTSSATESGGAGCDAVNVKPHDVGANTGRWIKVSTLNELTVTGDANVGNEIIVDGGVPRGTQPDSIILKTVNSPTGVVATAQSGGSLTLASVTGNSFVFSAANKTITITTGADFAAIKHSIGTTITITGSVSNNGTYTLTNATNTVLTVAETLINESAGASVTVTANTTVYFYSVIAFDANNMYSNPSKIAICYVTSANKTCSISWSSVTDAIKYGIYRGSMSVANGKDNASSNNATTMTDSTKNFTTFIDGEGLVKVREWIVNTTDGLACEITSIGTTTIVCAEGGMDWDSGEAYAIVRPRRQGLVAMDTNGSPYVHSSGSTTENIPPSGMALYTPNNVCIGYECMADYASDPHAKLSVYASHQDTQGATVVIRSGDPQESIANWVHRSSIVAHSEDIGGGTGSLAAGVFLAERNGETDQMSWNTGLFASYNQRKGTMVASGYPASGLRASSGSRGSETVTMTSGLGVAGIVGYIQNDNAVSAITDAYDFYAGNGSDEGAITNKYGMRIVAQNLGVNNYGLWLSGNGSGSDIVFGDTKQIKMSRNNTTGALSLSGGALEFSGASTLTNGTPQIGVTAAHGLKLHASNAGTNTDFALADGDGNAVFLIPANLHQVGTYGSQDFSATPTISSDTMMWWRWDKSSLVDAGAGWDGTCAGSTNGCITLPISGWPNGGVCRVWTSSAKHAEFFLSDNGATTLIGTATGNIEVGSRVNCPNGGATNTHICIFDGGANPVLVNDTNSTEKIFADCTYAY